MEYADWMPIRGKAQRELIRSIKRAEDAEQRAIDHRYELECKLHNMQFDRMGDIMLGRPVKPRASTYEREHAAFVFENLLREAKREDEMRDSQKRARAQGPSLADWINDHAKVPQTW